MRRRLDVLHAFIPGAPGFLIAVFSFVLVTAGRVAFLGMRMAEASAYQRPAGLPSELYVWMLLALAFPVLLYVVAAFAEVSMEREIKHARS